MRRALALLTAALVLLPAGAFAESWNVYRDSERGSLVLSAMPDEEESDTDLWLLCRKDGRFDVGAGANAQVGQGKGEAVSRTLTAGTKTATLRGISKESANFQMTAGTELVATIARNDALMDVLAAGTTIRMGSDKLPPPGKALSKFLAACPARK